MGTKIQLKVETCQSMLISGKQLLLYNRR